MRHGSCSGSYPSGSPWPRRCACRTRSPTPRGVNGIDDIEAAAFDALAEVGLDERARTRVRTLSGGQRQRLGIAAGYLAGVFAGTAWASPVVLVLGFAAMQLNASSDAFVAVTPVMHVVADAGRTENLVLSLYRLGFFALVAAVSVLLAARALRRPRRWKLPSPASWTVLAVAAALVAIPAAKPPAILAEETDPPIVCSEHDGLEYCVHEAHRAELDALSEAVPSVLAAHGSAPRSLRYVADVAGKHGLRDADRSNAIWVSLAPGNPNRYQARNAAAGYLSGMPACLDRFGPAVSPEEGPAQLRLAHGLGNWLLNRASDRAAVPATPFDGVSPAAMHEWISVHQHEIRTCTLGVEDVP